MQRRLFLKSLSAVFLPLIGKPAPAQQADPPAYTDSDARTPNQLAPLHDAQTHTGGVVYQP